MKTTFPQQKGFIRLFLIVLIALIAARVVFNFDIIAFLEGDWFSGILGSIWSLVKVVWYEYILKPIDWVLRR